MVIFYPPGYLCGSRRDFLSFLFKGRSMKLRDTSAHMSLLRLYTRLIISLI